MKHCVKDKWKHIYSNRVINICWCVNCGAVRVVKEDVKDPLKKLTDYYSLKRKKTTGDTANE